MGKKTEYMRLVAIGKMREAFLFTPDDGTPQRHYDISSLRIRIQTNRVEFTIGDIPMGDVYDFVLRNREADWERVDSLSLVELNDPVIFLQEPDGSHILVDGTHRILRLAREGKRFVPAYMVPEHLARRVDKAMFTDVDWS